MANLSDHFLDMVARGENPHRPYQCKHGLAIDLRFHRNAIRKLRLQRPLSESQLRDLEHHLEHEKRILLKMERLR